MRIRYGYDLKPGHPLRSRLGQGPPPEPDPSASTLAAYYGPPYTRFFPLLRPSGALGVISRGTAGGGAAGVEVGGGGGGGGPLPALGGPELLTDLYPWIYAPSDGFPFVLINANQGPIANGASAIVVALPQLPRGRMGVIKRFGNTASNLAGVTWTFLKRSQPTAPIIVFPTQYGNINDARPLPEPGTILESGDDFQIQVTNNSGAAISQVGAIATGYTWAMRG